MNRHVFFGFLYFGMAVGLHLLTEASDAFIAACLVLSGVWSATDNN